MFYFDDDLWNVRSKYQVLTKKNEASCHFICIKIICLFELIQLYYLSFFLYLVLKTWFKNNL